MHHFNQFGIKGSIKRILDLLKIFYNCTLQILAHKYL